MAKRTFRLAKLRFTSPLHLSTGRESTYDKTQATLQSDTLKSALFAMALQLFDPPPGEDFFQQFRISSGMPLWHDRLFFTKPLPKLNFVGQENEHAKQVKGIAYLEQAVFERYLRGELPKVPTAKQLDKSGKLMLATPDERLSADKPFETHMQQRVMVPRNGHSDAEPFFVEQLVFSPKAGLFVLIDECSDEFWAKLKACFRLLADEGVGSYRTSGNGRFEAEFVDAFELQVPDKSPAQVSLSMALPQEQEFDASEGLSYELVKRGGFISATHGSPMSWRKKSIHMFAPGSVFQKAYAGKVVDLQPQIMDEHPVWRDGRAIFLPFVFQPQNDD